MREVGRRGIELFKECGDLMYVEGSCYSYSNEKKFKSLSNDCISANVDRKASQLA